MQPEYVPIIKGGWLGYIELSFPSPRVRSLLFRSYRYRYCIYTGDGTFGFQTWKNKNDPGNIKTRSPACGYNEQAVTLLHENGERKTEHSMFYSTTMSLFVLNPWKKVSLYSPFNASTDWIWRKFNGNKIHYFVLYLRWWFYVYFHVTSRDVTNDSHNHLG